MINMNMEEGIERAKPGCDHWLFRECGWSKCLEVREWVVV